MPDNGKQPVAAGEEVHAAPPAPPKPEKEPENDDARSARQANELAELTSQHVKNTITARAAAERVVRQKLPDLPEELIIHSTEVREAVQAEHTKFATAARRMVERHRAEAPPPPSPHAVEEV